MAAAPMVEVRRGLALLRPHPHRGDLIAAGAVPFTLAIVLLNVRMDPTWGDGIHFVITGLACALVLGMGFLAEPEDEHPRAYQTVLLLSGLVLLAIALGRLAQVLGADGFLSSTGTLTWTSALFAAAAAAAAWGRIDSPVCALVELVAAALFGLAFVDWVFSPESPTTFRWILLLLIAVYAAGHVYWRDRKRRHAVHFVNAAGVLAAVLAASFLGSVFAAAVSPFGASAGSTDPGTWWELVLLAAGLGLIAYAAVDREPGPGYLGFTVLLLFAVLAGLPVEGGASIVGWPLLLLLAGGAALAAGLRPLAPLPPSPEATRSAAPTETLPGAAGPPGPEDQTRPLPPEDAPGAPGPP